MSFSRRTRAQAPTDNTWRTEADNDLRVAQSVALVRHMPVVVVGNGVGMLIGAFALHGHWPWTALAPMLFGMAYLLMPVALNWWRLRSRGRPATVSAGYLRRQIAYSAAMGCFWAGSIVYYLPGADFGVTSFVVLGAGFLALGACATLHVLP